MPWNEEWDETFTFTWRKDNYCPGHDTTVTLVNQTLRIAASGVLRQYRKGGRYFLMTYTGPVVINDTEVVYAIVKGRQHILVQNIENATLKAQQEKIYRLLNATEREEMWHAWNTHLYGANYTFDNSSRFFNNHTNNTTTNNQGDNNDMPFIDDDSLIGRFFHYLNKLLKKNGNIDNNYRFLSNITESNVTLGNFTHPFNETFINDTIPVEPPPPPPPLNMTWYARKPHIDVLMIDGLSRPQFIRGLKRTVNLFERIHNGTKWKFSVFQFLRYTVLGRNSIYNLTPMVFGRRYKFKRSQLREAVYDHPWLWDHAASNGYVTLMVDEQCQASEHIPEWQAPRDTGGNGRTDTYHHRFHDLFCDDLNQYGWDKRCLQSKMAHTYVFDYLKSFYSNYEKSPKFSWSILYEAHEPSLSHISLMDASLEDYLLHSLHNKNKITVILSDHGPHYGPYVFPPHPGELEQKMPTLFMLVPNGFLELNPGMETALRELEQVLITPLDIYSILLHLTYLPDPPSGDIPEDLQPVLKPGTLQRHRTCKDAKVPDEYCLCYPGNWDMVSGLGNNKEKNRGGGAAPDANDSPSSV